MSQYYAQLCIQVKSPESWKKLYDLNLSQYYIDADPKEFFDSSDLCCSISEEWSLDEQDLEFLVMDISMRLQKECIVIGECTNINVDTYTHIDYYLGNEVIDEDYSSLDDTELFGQEDDEDSSDEMLEGKGKMWGMFHNADINDIADCLTYYSLYGPGFSDEELEYIKEFGIVEVKCDQGIKFVENPSDISLSESSSKSGIQCKDRIPKIEKENVDNVVTQVSKQENTYSRNDINVDNSDSFLKYINSEEQGIEAIENLPNFGLPDSISLSGTRYEGRIERIEKVNVGDEVMLVREPENEYDRYAINVYNSEGSLGHVNASVCYFLASLLDKNKIVYTAKIDSVTPLSKRSKHCKNALISIHIEAKKK
jgi:hypothetical protein